MDFLIFVFFFRENFSLGSKFLIIRFFQNHEDFCKKYKTSLFKISFSGEKYLITPFTHFNGNHPSFGQQMPLPKAFAKVPRGN